MWWQAIFSMRACNRSHDGRIDLLGGVEPGVGGAIL
jgi:hypothetical protein